MWILGINRIALGLLAALLLGAALGAGVARQLGRAELQAVAAQQAAQQLASASLINQRLTTAAAASDAALTAQAQRVNELNETNRSLKNALNAKTSKRPCLSAAARGVLQQHPAFSRTELPTTPASAIAAAATATAYPSQPDSQPDSSERDIANWGLDVASAYETCRGRIDALRQWDEGVSRGR